MNVRIFFLNIQNTNYILSTRWMYDRCYSGRSSLKESFVEGIEQFVCKASQQDCYHNDEGSYVLVLNVTVLGLWRIEL